MLSLTPAFIDTSFYFQWVPEKDSQMTPLKITNPNQFAPQGVDPKELRNKHKDVSKF